MSRSNALSSFVAPENEAQIAPAVVAATVAVMLMFVGGFAYQLLLLVS